MLARLTKKYKDWKREGERYKNITDGLTVVNLGSSMSYYDFDYDYWSHSKWKGFNMASAPQTLEYDYKVLRQYSKHLADNCVVIISLAEFSLVVDKYPNDSYNYKYYEYLEPEAIDGYSRRKARMLKYMPGLLYPDLILNDIKTLIKKTVRYKNDIVPSIEKMSDNLFEGWMNEFGWKEKKDLSETQRAKISKTRSTLYSILEYIKENGWLAVIIIPPFPKYLMGKLPKNILKECLWDELEKIKEKGIPILDLTIDHNFSENKFYSTAVALNEEGKQQFNEYIQSQICDIYKMTKDNSEAENIKNGEDNMAITNSVNSNSKSYTLRNGVIIPWIAYGTGVVWKYTRNPARMLKVNLKEILSSIKHIKIHRELYGNIHIKSILSDAYSTGYRYFDTGRIYGKSEKYIGVIISEKKDVFIASKCSAMDVERDASPNTVRGNLEITLKNLHRNSLDLYMLHWPEGENWLKYYGEIIELYNEGKIKAFGICNATVDHLEEIEKAGYELPMVVQEECHPFYSRADVREYCKQHNIQYEAHTATARSGKIVRENEVLKGIAEKHHKSATQIIIRWHYQNGVIPVVSMFNKNHMTDNLDIFDFSLSDEEMKQIEALNNNTILLNATGIDDPNYIYND